MNLRIAMLLAAASCMALSVAAGQDFSSDFSKDVQPIFERRCQGCHGPTQQMSNLRLDSPASAARVLTRETAHPASCSKRSAVLKRVS